MCAHFSTLIVKWLNVIILLQGSTQHNEEVVKQMLTAEFLCRYHPDGHLQPVRITRIAVSSVKKRCEQTERALKTKHG